MANSGLLNIASLLLNNLDVTSIMKSMLSKVDMGQLGGIVSGALGSNNGNAAANSAPAAEAQAVAAPQSNNRGSFLQGLNINSFASPIQSINSQAMPGMFSQMFGGIAPAQGYQLQQPYLPSMDQGLINPYPISPYSYNYYDGSYMPPQEDL
jgi:hypothetical protein